MNLNSISKPSSEAHTILKCILLCWVSGNKNAICTMKQYVCRRVKNQIFSSWELRNGEVELIQVRWSQIIPVKAGVEKISLQSHCSLNFLVLLTYNCWHKKTPKLIENFKKNLIPNRWRLSRSKIPNALENNSFVGFFFFFFKCIWNEEGNIRKLGGEDWDKK